MQDAYACAAEACRSRCPSDTRKSKSLGKITRKIVGHLSFELHVGMHINGKPASHSEVVGISW